MSGDTSEPYIFDERSWTDSHMIESAPLGAPSQVPEDLPTSLPGDLLHASPSEPTGKIRVNHNYYDILEILFSSQSLADQRGTVCYSTQKDGQEFIIKDHWVWGDKPNTVLNEVTMLQRMEGVHGVPKLIEHCPIVEIAPGEADESEKYCHDTPQSLIGTFNRTHIRLVMQPRVRPLYMFRTKIELVSAIRDIVKIQQIAVEEHGILHRDGSLGNTMIEDDGDGSHGMLIDWEFAVEINKENIYTIGSGTLPFLSRELLNQLHMATPLEVSPCKRASHSLTTDAIKHTHGDDLESLFYVFIFICIEYQGPLGMKRTLDTSTPWLSHEWSGDTFRACRDAKTSFFFHKVHLESVEQQIHPYFQDLIPLAKEWYYLMRDNNNPDPVRFDDVIRLLDKHHSNLPKDEPPPELLFVNTSLKRKLPAKNIDHDGDRGAMGKLSYSDGATPMSLSAKNMTVEAAPLPKRSKIV